MDHACGINPWRWGCAVWPKQLSGRISYCAFNNRLPVSAVRGWTGTKSTDGLVRLGKINTSLVKIYSKERWNRGGNADLEEKLSGFSGAKSMVSHRFVVTAVTPRVPSHSLKRSPSHQTGIVWHPFSSTVERETCSDQGAYFSLLTCRW